MELKEDFIKDNKLDEDQVKNIKAESETQEAELKRVGIVKLMMMQRPSLKEREKKLLL